MTREEAYRILGATPRQARRIEQNLRYAEAARELSIAAFEVCAEWSKDDLTADAMSVLALAVNKFRTIADE